jgi:hypothetical protein
MPATALTVRSVTEAGTAEVAKVAADLSNGNTFANDGKNVWLEVQNAHATNSATVTFTTPGTVRGAAIADIQHTVAALTTTRFGPFDRAFYGDPVLVTITVTGTVTLAAWQILG